MMTTVQSDESGESTVPARFVKLFDVIDSIARQCVLPDQLVAAIDAYVASFRPCSDMPGKSDHLINIQLDFFEGLLREAGRRWGAASLLHFHLLETGDQSPKWRNWLATGLAARLGMGGQQRAMTIIERIASDDESFVRAHLEKRLVPDLEEAAAIPSLFDPQEARWIEHLGFARNELINFLNREGIAHDLVGLPEDPLLGVDTEAGSPSDEEANFRVRQIKQRRDLLEPAIDLAVKNADGSMGTADVWLSLKQLALNEHPPFTTAISERGGLAYNDHDSSGKPCINDFTKDALDARLRRRRKGVVTGK
jgi:hypothetical protein